MEKEKNLFEEELVSAIKQIEKHLEADEKEEIYQKALELSNKMKSLDKLKEKVKEVEKFYESVVNAYNKKVDEIDEEINNYYEVIESIEERIKKEQLKQYTENIKPLKLDITKDEIDKLDAEKLSNVIENIFKELMKY